MAASQSLDAATGPPFSTHIDVLPACRLELAILRSEERQQVGGEDLLGEGRWGGGGVGLGGDRCNRGK